jgi:site-specific DNA recombinase
MTCGRAAKDRQKHTRHSIATTGKLAAANRPRYLFSGLTKCGMCGAGLIMGSANRLSCFGARDQGTCSNKLTIRRDEVESRVLKALEEKLLRQDLFEEFCDEFTREMNRLRMEHRASLSSAERELERVQSDIRRVIEAIKNGLAGPDLKDEWDTLQERKTALQAKLGSADEPPPLLHPGIAELYRQKVTDLAQALQHPDTRTEAAESIRGLIDAIVLTPTEGALEAHVVRRGRRVQTETSGLETGLQIELKGKLAAMLSAAQNATRSPETGDLELQIVMVAGACNQRYLRLWG